jgi:hypothetical protein
MTKNIAVAALILCCAGMRRSAAADKRPDFESVGKPIQPAPPDSAIAEALRQVSAERVRQTIQKLVGFHNRNTLSSMNKDLKPGEGVLAAADWIESQFKSYSDACGGCLEVKRDTFTAPVQRRVPQPTTIVNVYAILRGSDPAQASRTYLVTGHYDSRDSDTLDTHGFAPGANDDASGVAVSLECARVLSKHKFPATLVFAAVAGEEQGLLGSAHLAQLAKQEGWHLGGALNNDIVGGNTTPGDELQQKSALRVFSEGIPATATPEEVRRIESIGAESDSPSRELAREVCAAARTYLSHEKNGAHAFHPVLELRRDRFLRGGDHISFNREGFAAVRFTEWREDFDHQHQNVRVENGTEYGDELKFVDFGYVANVARVNAATLATLASAPGEPAQVQILTTKLDNNTELRWKAPVGAPPGTKYEIVWRVTTAPDWQYAASSSAFGDSANGEDHTAKLPVSKDNVIFGVRSVDATGHRSAAVTPVLAR